MKTKLKSLCAAAVVSCAVGLLLPAGSVSASESASLAVGYECSMENSIEPRSNNLRWIFKVEDGKRYKRLYNTSTGNWVGDWIYIGEDTP